MRGARVPVAAVERQRFAKEAFLGLVPRARLLALRSRVLALPSSRLREFLDDDRRRRGRARGGGDADPVRRVLIVLAVLRFGVDRARRSLRRLRFLRRFRLLRRLDRLRLRWRLFLLLTLRLAVVAVVAVVVVLEVIALVAIRVLLRHQLRDERRARGVGVRHRVCAREICGLSRGAI